MMKPSLFISYSRQEVPFVDSLLDKLEDNGFRVWMDYHSLIPARPWLEEIYRGIAEADAVLFVVSKNSMASANVGAELMHAINLRKRIVLIIFEAMRLPPQLAGCEWVDFRGSFSGALAELMTQLMSPVQKR